MPDDLYSDAPDAMTAQAAASNSASADETPKGNEDQPTALIAKSALGGYDCKPGDEITFKVIRVMDDQVEAQLLREKKGSEPESAKEDAAEPGEEPTANPMSEYMG